MSGGSTEVPQIWVRPQGIAMLCWAGSQQKGKMSYLCHFKRHWVLSWGNWMELSIFINSNRNTRIWNWISVCVLCSSWLSKLPPWLAKRDVSRVTCLRCLFQCGTNLCAENPHPLCVDYRGNIWKAAGKQQRAHEKKCPLLCVLFSQNIFLLVQIRSVEFTGKSLCFNEKNSRSKDTSKSVLLL